MTPERAMTLFVYLIIFIVLLVVLFAVLDRI